MYMYISFAETFCFKNVYSKTKETLEIETNNNEFLNSNI